jgi:hypothetical protein
MLEVLVEFFLHPFILFLMSCLCAAVGFDIYRNGL